MASRSWTCASRSIGPTSSFAGMSRNRLALSLASVDLGAVEDHQALVQRADDGGGPLLAGAQPPLDPLAHGDVEHHECKKSSSPSRTRDVPPLTHTVEPSARIRRAPGRSCRSPRRGAVGVLAERVGVVGVEQRLPLRANACSRVSPIMSRNAWLTSISSLFTRRRAGRPGPLGSACGSAPRSRRQLRLGPLPLGDVEGDRVEAEGAAVRVALDGQCSPPRSSRRHDGRSSCSTSNDEITPV